MKKIFFSLLVIVCAHLNLNAQADDSLTLEEVTVKAYLDKQPLLRVPASITLLDSAGLNAYPGQSLVPSFNTAAGLRMEERSPMSYRLSIRGSLIRSPFGIRNVKIYIDEFPLTDAGGNAYLNLIDINSLSSVEVLKGPNGSLFGANSGGVIRLGVMDLPPDNLRLTVNAGAGSFGFWHENVKLEKQIGKHTFSFSQAIQRSDGYRENSAAQRIYVQATESWKYNSASEIRALFFYSDLDYRTPGGLNLDQWNTNPRAARPATATLPGASEQKAGVHNSTFYGGLLHETHFGKYFRHVFALFGSHTDFENPFITNYETRKENTSGLRTWIEAKNDQQKNFAWKYDLGVEAQQTFSNINNYENLSGVPGPSLDEADLHAVQDFVFTRLSFDLYHRFLFEASASVNQMRYSFSNNAGAGSRKFLPELMPRFAFSWLVTSYIAFRASVSKGYSPPTLAEIRSSDNVVNTTLRPESGWNYETGFRFRDKNGRAQWDFCIFYYQLQDAIVRRLNDDGEEYFINAGGTQQVGAELQS
jgi:iron complex outermembrane receptor protein